MQFFNNLLLKIQSTKLYKWFFGLFLFLLFFIPNVKADSVKIYTSNIPNTSYLSVGSGSRQLNFETDNVYYDASELPRYFLLTFCTDSQRISTYSINSSGGNPSLDTVVFYKTDFNCSFPGSNYTGGKLLYVYGTYNVAYNCGASGTNCTQKGSVNMTVPNQSSWTLYSYQNSIEEISVDYASGTIISQNASIMSYQQQIINNQTANTNAINGNIDQEFNDLKNQDHTYNSNAKDTPSGTSDVNSTLNKQDQLSSSLNLDSSNVVVTLNTNATTYIWGIVDRIRAVDSRIVLLFTTVLSLGIIKMILNR